MNRVTIDVYAIAPPEWLDAATAFARAVLDHKGFLNWDVSILVCDDPYIAQLNETYRHKEGPTDVLSFEQGDEYADAKGNTRFLAGDIVISLPALLRNAEDFSVSWKEELQRLIIHGILHLSGMDHGTNDASEPMLTEQEELLRHMDPL